MVETSKGRSLERGMPSDLLAKRIPHFAKVGLVVLVKKVLTHDGRCPTQDDGRQLTPINSNDLNHATNGFEAESYIIFSL